MTSAPDWIARVRTALEAGPPDWFTQFAPPPAPARTSAVLMLFGPRGVDGRGVDVVLTERSELLRSHAAQVALPGGHVDPGDGSTVAAALREAREEVGIDADTVEIVDTLPGLYMRPSGTCVTPVLAWWARPHPIGVVDPAEVARVARADVAELLDPAHRFTVTAGAYRSPGFEVEGLFVWGFTAKLLDTVLELAGLTRPWDTSSERPLPEAVTRGYRRMEGSVPTWESTREWN